MCLFSRADRGDHVALCLRGIRSLLDLNGRLIGRKRRDLSRKMDVGRDVDGIAAAKHISAIHGPRQDVIAVMKRD